MTYSRCAAPLQHSDVSFVVVAAKALKDNRDAFFLATKFALTMDEQGNFGVRGDAEHVRYTLMALCIGKCQDSKCRDSRSHAHMVSYLPACMAATSYARRMPGTHHSTLSSFLCRQACDKSLQDLGIQTIDLYYQHRVDKNVPIEDTVRAMAVREHKSAQQLLSLQATSTSVHDSTGASAAQGSCCGSCVVSAAQSHVQCGAPPTLVATLYCCRSW